MDIKMSLYKIADALGITLEYEDGKVTAQSTGTLPLLPLLDLTMPLKVNKFFANEVCGVIAHVVGDLHLIVSHYNRTNIVSVFIIDGSKLEMEGVKTPPELFVTKSMSLKQVVNALRVGIVSSFVWKDRTWGPLKLPT